MTTPTKIQDFLDNTQFENNREQEKAKQMLLSAIPDHIFSFYQDWYCSDKKRVNSGDLWLLLQTDTELYKLLESVEKASGMSIEIIRSRCRKVEIVAARVLFAMMAVKLGYRHDEIGMYVNLSRPTVTYLVGKRYNPHKSYYEYLKKMENGKE